MQDVIIIGAGILGTTLARKLSAYQLDVLVLEKAYDLGEGATKANSAVLSAGYHARAESLKGISAVRGNRMYREICSDLGVKVSYPGSLHCAFSEEGMQDLEKKRKRGCKNGAEGLKMISGDQARTMQPGLSEQVVGALYAPNTGIIDIFQLLVRTAQAAAINGVSFLFDAEVTAIDEKEEGYRVTTAQGEFQCRYLVNTAGEEAAVLEAMVRPQELCIAPRRGQFVVYDKGVGDQLNYVLYQQQETDEKGCLLAPTVEGNLVAGPTSEDVESFENTDTTVWGIAHIIKVAEKILPGLDHSRVIAEFAGVRANITNVEKEQKDFVIRISAPHMISALGIKNPGMTSAPYLMDLVTEYLQQEGLVLVRKDDWIQKPDFQPRFLDADEAQQKKMLAEDPACGRIICRCERVTEGDLKAVLRQPLPPKSMNGLKKRLRIGMGRCQGGFCTPRVIELLAQAWNVSPEEIVKSTAGSMMVKGQVK